MPSRVGKTAGGKIPGPGYSNRRMNITPEFLVGWVGEAKVVRAKFPGHTLFVGTLGDDVLYFSARHDPHRIWPNNRADIQAIFVANGVPEVITTPVKAAGYTTHTTGVMWGERVEELFQALIKRVSDVPMDIVDVDKEPVLVGD